MENSDAHGMKKDRFRRQFAESTAEAFRQVFADKYRAAGDTEVFDPDFIQDNLEKPKDPKMGRFAFPVFKYGRLLGCSPQEISARVAPATVATGVASLDGRGFLNGRVDFVSQAEETISSVLAQGEQYGDSDEGAGCKYLVEYSSVNIAKPFGISHLRTTILGYSLKRIMAKLGYDTVGINFLGDWGTQFGKLIVAYRKWGRELDLKDDAVGKLFDLYVRFHDEAEADDTLNDEARQAFKELEEGHQEAVAIWRNFRDISLKEFDRVYRLLGVEFDWITSESFLNDKMEPVIERLQQTGLASLSQGALVVDLDDPQLPPCLLKKADGATLYATRDLAGLIYRWKEYRFEESLYVVASSQADHFKQIFKVIELLEDAENLKPDDRMTGRIKHIEFGWVKFGDKTMSTRRGNIILLEDVINRAVNLASDKILEKNPDLKAIDETARMIGIGAVIFSQLSVRRRKDVNFSWEEALSFEGETGPYLQYTHARLCSLMRHYGRPIGADVDFALLKGDEEERVVELLADFPQSVLDAARNYDPYFVAVHLLKLAAAFNKVYQRKDAQGRIDKIVSDDPALSAVRLTLVSAVQLVLKTGLHLLGLQAPQEM
ncbi:MAG: arginine--tRNA ligase [bacterium]